MATIRPLSINPTLINRTERRPRPTMNEIPRRWSHVHHTYPMIESRVM